MRYTTYTRTFIAAAILALAAGCNKFSEPDSPGKGMNIKPVFNTEIPSSTTKAGDAAESRTLEPLILDDGTQIDMSVTKDAEWPIAGPQDGAVLTKGTVYSGAAAYEAKSFRLYAWNASQSSSVLFAAKEYTCDAQHNWSTAQPPEWLSSSDSLAFVGVWDSSEIATASIVSGKYAVSNWDVSGNYADQKDLRAAFATYPADHNGDALLYFNPYMNAIRVKVGDLPENYSVTKVELKGVGVKGSLVFPDSYTPVPPVSGRDSYVGAWTDITAGNLSLAGNWTSGTSVTPDGTAFLFIDPDGGTLAGAIEVTFTDPSGNTTVKSKNLSELGTDVKCGKAFTVSIGSTFIYTFEVDDPDALPVMFFNTTSPETQAINILSTVMIDGGEETPVDWEIKSVQVGSAAAETIDGTSFTGKGGISAVIAMESDNNFEITAAERDIFIIGSNDYWTNKNGISGDSSGSLWSPKSWGSDGLNKGVIDLSRYNFRDETTNNPMTTANCYIIRHAGTYKLPLVYGNAIQGGEECINAYSPGREGNNELATFVNHLGNGITDPFIENNDGCEAQSGIVLWQEADIIRNLEIVPASTSGHYDADNVSYLQFEIPQDVICQNNALIAVRDENNRIMWSWHIWTTNDPALLSDAVPVKNHVGTTYKFFPLNCIGWTDPSVYPQNDVIIVLRQAGSGNEITVRVSQQEISSPNSCCRYQFGRKDPIPAGASRISADNANVQQTILNPDIIYGCSSDDWMGSEFYHNLWTGLGSAPKKTIYDPSPVGYQIPAGDAFTGFTKSGDSETYSTQYNISGPFVDGWHFKTGFEDLTIFFPIIDAYIYSYPGGSYLEVGDYGYYWTTEPYRHGGHPRESYNLRFFGYEVSPLYRGHRADALAVRPVTYPSNGDLTGGLGPYNPKEL